MDNLLIVAKQVAILFLLMGVGFFCRRRKILDDSSSKGIVDVLILFVTPMVIVDAFLRPFDPTMMKGLGIAFGAAVLAHVVLISLACLLVRHWADGTRRVLRIAAVFSNAGFMGIPLEQAILGDRGVFFGTAYIVVFNLFIWSWGYGVMKNEKCRMKNEECRVKNEECGGKDVECRMRNEECRLKNEVFHIIHYSLFIIHSLVRSPKFLNPGTVGLMLGMIGFLLPWGVPEVIRTPIHAMAAMNTPLAMIVIGYYLAGAKLGSVLRMRSAHVSAAMRLVVAPLLMTAALYPFRHALDRDMMLALVIASAAPVAAMVSMFAAKFGRDVDASVGLVSGTTILSIVTMPPVVALAMSIL